MRRRHLPALIILATALLWPHKVAVVETAEPVLWVLHDGRVLELDVTPEDAQHASDLWLGCEVYTHVYRGEDSGEARNSTSGAEGTPQLYQWRGKMRAMGLNPDDDADRIVFAFWLKDNSQSGWYNWAYCERARQEKRLPSDRLEQRETGAVRR